MNLNDAIDALKDNATGANEYETLSTWQEIEEAAESEIGWLGDRIRQLQAVTAIAREHLYKDQQ